MKCKDVNYELRAKQTPFNFKLNRVVTLEETILEFQKKTWTLLEKRKNDSKDSQFEMTHSMMIQF